MLVPETAMNEDDLFSTWENQIGSPREILTMQTISESHSMNYTANQYLGFRIPSSYTPHETTAKVGGNVVRHCEITGNSIVSLSPLSSSNSAAVLLVRQTFGAGPGARAIA